MGEPQRTRPGQEILFWLALLIALSPTLFELTEHWQTNAWARYSLGFLPLLICAVRGGTVGRTYRSIAFWLLLFCLVGQFAVGFVSLPRLARPLAGLAIVAFLLHREQASPRTALLAVFLIPVPSVFIVSILHGNELAGAFAEAGAATLRVFGISATALGREIHTANGELRLTAYWSGLLLSFQALGLGWYYALQRGLGLRSSGIALAAAVPLAFALQLALVVLAAAATAGGAKPLPGLLIDPGSWLIAFAIGVVASHWPSEGSEATPAAP